jgi:hypothetical protein
VPSHSGNVDAATDADTLALADGDAVALTEGVTDGVTGGATGATRVELTLGTKPSNDGDAHCVELMA